MAEEPRCFICANGNPVEPRMHYVKERSMQAFLHAAGLQLGARTTEPFATLSDVATLMQHVSLLCCNRAAGAPVLHATRWRDRRRGVGDAQ